MKTICRRPLLPFVKQTLEPTLSVTERMTGVINEGKQLVPINLLRYLQKAQFYMNLVLAVA